MHKYRDLSIQELENLKPKFVQFLIVNGVEAVEWEKLKLENSTQANLIISEFSQVIWEMWLSQTLYLIKFLGKTTYLFKCHDDEISLIGLETEEDLADIELFFRELQEYPNKFHIFQKSKPYFPSRNQEIYNMMQQGCSVSDGYWYDQMQNIQYA